jgi:hypothetical protein
MVLTAGRPVTFGDPEADREIAAFQYIWVHQLQPQLARLSTRGRQVIEENSSHGFDSEGPDPVVGAVREVVLEIERISLPGEHR